MFSHSNIPPLLFIAVVPLLFFQCTPAPSLETAKQKGNRNEQNTFDRADSTIAFQIISFNDFHGNLPAKKRDGKQVGGAASFASVLLSAADSSIAPHTFFVHAGDHIGASPPLSALLQDEPSIAFFARLGNQDCTCQSRYSNRCNLIAIPGNHEFDEGVNELKRMVFGGNHPKGPFIESPYEGAPFSYICANVINKENGEMLFPASTIKEIDGIPVGFIGAVTSETPSIVLPSGVRNVQFINEAEAINAEVKKLKADSIEAIVVVIHQGGHQKAYMGDTRTDSPDLQGPIVSILEAIDPEVDLVITGHTHSFTNCFYSSAKGGDFLVTQAFSNGKAFADIRLTIHRTSKDIIDKSARIFTTTDQTADVSPDSAIDALLENAETLVGEKVNRTVVTLAEPLSRSKTKAGESALGALIADAQRAAMGTDCAFMNPGGVRANLPSGEISWGMLYSVQPFGNHLVKMGLSGKQILDVLSQQWCNQSRILHVAGMHYSWDKSDTSCNRVTSVSIGGKPIDSTESYTVTVNSFLAEGGDNFSIFTKGTNREIGIGDLEALIRYMTSTPEPFKYTFEPRITLGPAKSE